MGSMLYMGISGTALIVAVICFRYFFLQQIPKRFFVFLWICAIARLLLPVAIPVRWPVPGGFRIVSATDRQQVYHIHFDHQLSAGRLTDTDSQDLDNPAEIALEKTAGLKTAVLAVWLIVAVLLAVWIFKQHRHSRKIYDMSLPLDEAMSAEWRKTHYSFRTVDLRKSEFIKSPLTYGVFRPVILLPSNLRLEPEERFCVLEHEWIHIRRWDVLVKYLLYLTVCIYWFHPLVWLMAVLMNRDMETACDEETVSNFSDDLKKTYARMLVRLAEEHGNSLWWSNVCFARRSEIEERIWLIMKAKKYTGKAAVLAAGMLCCAVTTFTVSAQKTPEQDFVKTESARTPEQNSAKTENAKIPEQTFAEAGSSAKRGSDSGNTEDVKRTAATDAADQIDTQSDIKEQIAVLAKSCLGVPFQYGGTDLSKGVDSPGFVKAVYAQFGIELPADLRELAAGSTAVSPEDLCAGDIVIYCSADGSDPWFHAAIYDGSGHVIHASNLREGVKISDFNYREISTAVRIIG